LFAVLLGFKLLFVVLHLLGSIFKDVAMRETFLAEFSEEVLKL
jgi:hypothetical protein